MMLSAPRLIEAVDAVGRHYQVDDLRLNDEQMATLAFSDDLTVTIEHAVDPYTRALLIAELGGIRESAFEELATGLLAVNGRWMDTACASFAMHPYSDKVLAILPVHAAALSSEALPQIMDGFLSNCRKWVDKLNRGETDFSLRDDIEAALDAFLNA